MTMRTLATLATSMAVLVASGQPTSMGTELWVTYMENLNLQFNGPPSFELVISADVATQGEVQIPYTGFSIPYSVGALSDTVITLPTNIYYPQGDETTFNFGIRVVADYPVSVYAYHERAYFSEAAMVLPYDRLGTDHLVLAHEDATGNSPSEFVVLATADSTVVQITPSVLTVGFRPPGIPFTVTLDQGQVFQLQAFGDLSGSRVRSMSASKRIAVFAGARQAIVNCTGSADDHLYQQIEPLSAWGRLFRIVPFKQRNGDEIRVLASTDSTEITLTGQAPFMLDSGEVADLFVTIPLTISATAPIAVGQFNDSQVCNAALGDPCYLWIPPATLTDERAIWSALTGLGTPEHFVNVVVSGEVGAPTLFLDGVNVSSQLQPMSGVPGIFWGQYNIAAGLHMLESASGMEAWAYGMGDYNSYSFPLGYGSSPLSSAIPDVQTSTDLGNAVLLPQGSTFDAARCGMDARSTFVIIDATGRIVCTVAPSAQPRLELAPGQYTVHVLNATMPNVLRLMIQ